MRYVNDISSIITIVSAVFSLITLINTRRIRRDIINQSVSIILSDLQKAQANMYQIYSNNDDKNEELIALRNISDCVDRLQQAYTIINDKASKAKIDDARKAIRSVQEWAGHLNGHQHFIHDMNKCLDKLY